MLYMLHMGNHPDIHYLKGQEPIIHLVAGMKKTVEWAKSNDLRWGNGARHCIAVQKEIPRKCQVL